MIVAVHEPRLFRRTSSRRERDARGRVAGIVILSRTNCFCFRSIVLLRSSLARGATSPVAVNYRAILWRDPPVGFFYFYAGRPPFPTVAPNFFPPRPGLS